MVTVFTACREEASTLDPCNAKQFQVSISSVPLRLCPGTLAKRSSFCHFTFPSCCCLLSWHIGLKSLLHMCIFPYFSTGNVQGLHPFCRRSYEREGLARLAPCARGKILNLMPLTSTRIDLLENWIEQEHTVYFQAVKPSPTRCHGYHIGVADFPKVGVDAAAHCATFGWLPPLTILPHRW